MSDVMAHITYADATDSTDIANTLGQPMKLLWRDDDQPRFEHRCDRRDRGVIICAPSLDPAHQVTGTRERPTVRASVLCPDCGLHGYITDGAWS